MKILVKGKNDRAVPTKLTCYFCKKQLTSREVDDQDENNNIRSQCYDCFYKEWRNK